MRPEIKESLCCESAENGASPVLTLPRPPSQERRRLNFDGALTSSGANRRSGASATNAFRRYIESFTFIANHPMVDLAQKKLYSMYVKITMLQLRVFPTL